MCLHRGYTCDLGLEHVPTTIEASFFRVGRYNYLHIVIMHEGYGISFVALFVISCQIGLEMKA
jgi:hypothetical protein